LPDCNSLQAFFCFYKAHRYLPNGLFPSCNSYSVLRLFASSWASRIDVSVKNQSGIFSSGCPSSSRMSRESLASSVSCSRCNLGIFTLGPKAPIQFSVVTGHFHSLRRLDTCQNDCVWSSKKLNIGYFFLRFLYQSCSPYILSRHSGQSP